MRKVLAKKPISKKGVKRTLPTKKRFKRKARSKIKSIPARVIDLTVQETIEPELIILFKVTSRSRPHKFKYTIDNIIGNCNNPAYYILASADIEDTSMNTDEIKQFCRERNVLLKYGSNDGKTKIDAINRDMNDNSDLPDNWDILVNVSDDQYFTVKGFDDMIRDDYEKNMPTLDGIMHYSDGNRDDLMTMSIMGKPWYDRFKRIYYEKYISVRCDDDAMNEAKAMEKYDGKKHYHYSGRGILVHAHAAYGKKHPVEKVIEKDAQYLKNETKKVHDRDKVIYDSREFHNFNIPYTGKRKD